MKTRHVGVVAALVLVGCQGLDSGESSARLSGSADDCDPPKVAVCHVPPGNPANAHTICVGAPAEDAHLAHGDSPGGCSGDCGLTGFVCVIDGDCCDGLACVSGTCHPACVPATEACGDFIDNDCDGEVDEGCLGGRAWFDEDGDGIQDPGEPGHSASFLLFNVGELTLFGMTTTDASGAYYFSDVPPGTYKVQGFAPLTDVTATDAGSDDTLDNDFLRVGPASPGITSVFTYAGAADYTVDFGVVLP